MQQVNWQGYSAYLARTYSVLKRTKSEAISNLYLHRGCQLHILYSHPLPASVRLTSEGVEMSRAMTKVSLVTLKWY